MAQEPLTDAQRALICAWVDGELAGPEAQQAEALAKRADTAEYARQLRAVRGLVTQHGVTGAPPGVLQSVRAEIGAKQGKVHQLPAFSWRAPAFSAAATILVALAIMFGPALVSPSPPPPDSIALDPALPTEESAKTEGTLQSDAPVADAVLDLEKLNEEAGEEADEEAEKAPVKEDMRWAETASKKAPTPAANTGLSESKLDGAADETKSANRLKGEARDDRAAPPPPEAPADRLRKQPAEEGAPEDAASRVRRGFGAGGGRGGEAPQPAPSAQDSKDKEVRRAETDSADGENAEPEQGKSGAREIELRAGEPLAVQTEALWISALYGTSRLVTHENGAESISVEVESSRVEELASALAKLSAPAADGKAAFEQQGRPPKIGDLLPEPALKDRYDDDGTTTVVIRIR